MHYDSHDAFLNNSKFEKKRKNKNHMAAEMDRTGEAGATATFFQLWVRFFNMEALPTKFWRLLLYNLTPIWVLEWSLGVSVSKIEIPQKKCLPYVTRRTGTAESGFDHLIPDPTFFGIPAREDAFNSQHYLLDVDPDSSLQKRARLTNWRTEVNKRYPWNLYLHFASKKSVLCLIISRKPRCRSCHRPTL